MATNVDNPSVDLKTDIKIEDTTTNLCEAVEEKVHDEVKPEQKEQGLKEEIKYFQCHLCIFKQSYDYFGRNPTNLKNYILLEDAYVIEDPFFPPKQGKIIILGAHCIKCTKSVCKDVNCSVYFDGTYCIECAKCNIKSFPPTIQEKLYRII